MKLFYDQHDLLSLYLKDKKAERDWTLVFTAENESYSLPFKVGDLLAKLEGSPAEGEFTLEDDEITNLYPDGNRLTLISGEPNKVQGSSAR